MRIVADTSPLIFLSKIGKLGLLEEYQILIPAQVYAEIEAGKAAQKEDYLKIEALVKERKIEVKNVPLLKDVPFTVGTGENAAVALAIQEKIPLVLIDDKKGWKLAKLNTLTPKGTLAVLIEAYKKKQLSKMALRRLIEELMECGFRLPQEKLLHLLNIINEQEEK